MKSIIINVSHTRPRCPAWYFTTIASPQLWLNRCTPWWYCFLLLQIVTYLKLIIYWWSAGLLKNLIKNMKYLVELDLYIEPFIDFPISSPDRIGVEKKSGKRNWWQQLPTRDKSLWESWCAALVLIDSPLNIYPTYIKITRALDSQSISQSTFEVNLTNIRGAVNLEQTLHIKILSIIYL